MMPEMKTLNGYEVVDAKARQDIEALKMGEVDLTGYATEAYVDTAISNIPEVDLSKHALKSELPTKVSQLQNDSKFITREEVPETDLSEYAKKSEIPDVSDFITSIPSEYITESELNAKGYLTQHQDISGKADKNHTHPEYLTEHQSLANYATKKYVDDAIADIDIPEGADLSGYAKKTDIPTKVSQLANDSNYLTSIPGEYITESELNAKGYLTEHQSLADYARKSELFTWDYNDLTNKPTIPSTDGLATEDYVDEAIANIEIPEGDGSGTPLYQHTVRAEFTEYAIGQRKNPHIYVTFIDSRSKAYTLATFVANLYNKQKTLAVSGNVYLQRTSSDGDIYPIDYIEPASETSFKFSYRTSSTAVPNLVEVASTETCTFLDTVVRVGTAAAGEEIDLSEYALKSEIPDVSNFITEVPEEYVTETELNAKGYLTEHQSLAGYATEKYVDDAVAGIDIPETDLSNYYTKSQTYSKTEVDEAIANIDIPGGSGGGIKRVLLGGWSYDSTVANNVDELVYLCNYYLEHGEIPSDCEYYVKPDEYCAAMLITYVGVDNYDSEYALKLGTGFTTDSNCDRVIFANFTKDADGKCSTNLTYYQVNDISLDLSRTAWQETPDIFDGMLYNSPEVYVMVALNADSTQIAYSHFLGNTAESKYVLGDNTFVEYPFVISTSNTDLQDLSWHYNGNGIELSNDTVSVICIRYKMQL